METVQPINKSEGESRREQIASGHVDPSLFPCKKPLRDLPPEELIERSVERSCDHRLEERYPAELTGAPTHVSLKDFCAQVRDISPSGIGLSGACRKAIGEEVKVKFLNCDPLSGHVIWRKGERFGIQFGENAIEFVSE